MTMHNEYTSMSMCFPIFKHSNLQSLTIKVLKETELCMDVLGTKLTSELGKKPSICVIY